MEKAWIGLAGTVVGALLGGAYLVLISRRERDWERDKFIQERLEEIFRLTVEMRELAVTLSAQARDAGRGIAKYKDEQEERLRNGLRRLDALVLFYAPMELRVYAAALRKLYDADALEGARQDDPQAVLALWRQFADPKGKEAMDALRSETVRLARQRLRVDAAWK